MKKIVTALAAAVIGSAILVLDFLADIENGG